MPFGVWTLQNFWWTFLEKCDETDPSCRNFWLLVNQVFFLKKIYKKLLQNSIRSPLMFKYTGSKNQNINLSSLLGSHICFDWSKTIDSVHLFLCWVQFNKENEYMIVALQAVLASYVELFALKSLDSVLGVCWCVGCHMDITRCWETPPLCQVSV